MRMQSKGRGGEKRKELDEDEEEEEECELKKYLLSRFKSMIFLLLFLPFPPLFSPPLPLFSSFF